MTNYKRLFSLFLVTVMVLACFAGCGAETTSAEADAPATEDVSSVEAAPAEVEAPPAEEPAPVEEASVAESFAVEAEAETIDNMGSGVMTFEDEVKAAAEGNFINLLLDFDYAEETTLPVTDEDISFSYFFSTQPFMMAYGGEVDYSSLTYFKEWSERTGVGLDLIPVSLMEASTKFQLMIASGDYANIIEGIDGYTGGAGAAIDDEVIYDLTDVAADYMPNYTAWLDSNSDYAGACSTVDGRLYSAGYLRYGALTNSMGGILNQDWLEETGLDTPVTYDDMYNVLTAMKDNGHSGAFWMTSALTCVGYTYTAGYDLDIETGFMNIDGTIDYALIGDNCKSYLEMLNKWYSEGLIYPEFMTIDSTSDTIDSGLVTGQTVGVYSGQWDTAETMMNDGGITLTPYTALRQSEEQVLHVAAKAQYTQGGASIATSVDKDDLPIAAAMIDYLYSKEGVILSNFGVEGEGYVLDENGNPTLSDLILNNPNVPMLPVGLVLYTKFGGPGINFAPREYGAYSDAYWDACMVWNENGRDNSYMLPYTTLFTSEESLAVSNIMTDIETLAEEYLISFVVGERDFSEWDAYVATVESMGIQDAIDIYQTALDRYLA